jgi:hypothetical protein
VVEMLNAYFTVNQIAPAMMLLIVGVIFASVRCSERIKPIKVRRDG